MQTLVASPTGGFYILKCSNCGAFYRITIDAEVGWGNPLEVDCGTCAVRWDRVKHWRIYYVEQTDSFVIGCAAGCPTYPITFITTEEPK